MATKTYSASLVTQGDHKFYSLTMPSEVLTATCTVDTREANPLHGFQRALDEKRAEEIAKYIDSGFGTIPTAIVLSAQQQAHLKYTSKRRSITFEHVPGAFLILDGQHRVYGFSKASKKLRVPVVIYNNLTRQQESRLFIDINTKQRPVPNELLLDITALAETETDQEALLRELFDRFHQESTSPLLGLLSPAKKAKGKLSRVSFNGAGKLILPTIGQAEPERVYKIVAAYLRSWLTELEKRDLADRITNPTLFSALFRLFPDVALRVSDRSGDYNVSSFTDVLEPLFKQLKDSKIASPGQSPVQLANAFKDLLTKQFTLG